MSCISLNLITAVLLPLGGAAVDRWNFYQISQPQRVYITEGPGCRASARVCVPSWRSKHELEKKKKETEANSLAFLANSQFLIWCSSRPGNEGGKHNMETNQRQQHPRCINKTNRSTRARW